jgi:hypothetical protein
VLVVPRSWRARGVQVVGVRACATRQRVGIGARAAVCRRWRAGGKGARVPDARMHTSRHVRGCVRAYTQLCAQATGKHIRTGMRAELAHYMRSLGLPMGAGVSEQMAVEVVVVRWWSTHNGWVVGGGWVGGGVGGRCRRVLCVGLGGGGHAMVAYSS